MTLKILVLSFIIGSSSSLVAAQSAQRGIYLTADSFYRHQLIYTPIMGNSYHLKLHDVFYKPYITIVRGDTSVYLAKASIFGYEDETGTSYRFFNKQIYELQNADSSLTLYAQKTYHGGKPVQVETTYYFSHGSQPPMQLTRLNLATAFSDNAAFIGQVYDQFETDDALASYDKYRRMFRLSSLYQKSYTRLP